MQPSCICLDVCWFATQNSRRLSSKGRSRSRRQRGALSRGTRLWPLVAACLTLYVLSDLWRAAHLLLEPHSTCPYDGALVHQHDVVEMDRGLQRDLADARTSLFASHAHDDCQLSIGPQRPPLLPALAAGELRTQLLPGSRIDITRVSVRSRAVLEYAPKLSPPSLRATA